MSMKSKCMFDVMNLTKFWWPKH